MTSRNTPDKTLSPTIPISSEEFAGFMCSAEPFKTDGPLVVAVSGGADSLGLLSLLTGWAGAKSVSLIALTVDHGLRPESGDEAALVGRWCAEMGVPHDILCWMGDKPVRGIQEAARRARYALLEDWCVRHGASDLLVAHTENDQAETFLFRMSRGSGPDGLAAMPLVSCRGGIRIVRPLLGVSRARMEATLRAAGRTWVDDPGNADRRYTRVR
ncbi:MAG: tRNA lysidine(34) synthetase TilS, partial [Pseudomonadota bacterium]|nr:tRNA lysidine(34) synthetase TilS [Pseudomonadota bacterium]